MPAGHRAGWVALISCFSFRVAFSVSLGPLPYIITAEVFPASGWPILSEAVGFPSPKIWKEDLHKPGVAEIPM